MSLPFVIYDLLHWERYGPEMKAINLPFLRGLKIYFSLSSRKARHILLIKVWDYNIAISLVSVPLSQLGTSKTHIPRGHQKKAEHHQALFIHFRSTPTCNQSPLHFTALSLIFPIFLGLSISILDIYCFELLMLGLICRT